MTQEKLGEMQKELRAVTEKYGIVDAAFAGTEKGTEIYLGVYLDDPCGAQQAFQTVLNIGRLWQHARTGVRADLDRFEKSWRDER